jgi:hypothetical protein
MYKWNTNGHFVTALDILEDISANVSDTKKCGGDEEEAIRYSSAHPRLTAVLRDKALFFYQFCPG